MTRFMLSVGLLIVLVGCSSDAEDAVTVNSDAASTSVTLPNEDKSGESNWRLVDSNEWYDLFELTLTETESLICTAFHKTDAQLGIGIAINVAVLADDRGFKFFTFNEASLSDDQMTALAPKLPKERVLESYAKIQYLMTEPEKSGNHVFDAEFMTQMRRNQADEFE